MSENYQAVNDAVRDAFSMANHHIEHAANEWISAARDTTRPHIMYKLIPERDGDQWCVLLGADLQVGIAGFGDTPQKACHDFDKSFGWIG